MELDLHGVRHANVPKLLDKVIYEAFEHGSTELRIQTGNSQRMKDVVNECLADYSLFGEESMLNNGVLIITF